VKIFFVIIFLAFFYSVNATMQEKEAFIYDGDTLFDNIYPLHQYKEYFPDLYEKIQLNNDLLSSANHRGYKGTWRFINDSLFLVGLQNIRGIDIPFEDLFDNEKISAKGVFAFWYTDTVKLKSQKTENINIYRKSLYAEIVNGVSDNFEFKFNSIRTHSFFLETYQQKLFNKPSVKEPGWSTYDFFLFSLDLPPGSEVRMQDTMGSDFIIHIDEAKLHLKFHCDYYSRILPSLPKDKLERVIVKDSCSVALMSVNRDELPDQKNQKAMQKYYEKLDSIRKEEELILGSLFMLYQNAYDSGKVDEECIKIQYNDYMQKLESVHLSDELVMDLFDNNYLFPKEEDVYLHLQSLYYNFILSGSNNQYTCNSDYPYNSFFIQTDGLDDEMMQLLTRMIKTIRFY
jgi:hypothetical protein